jgi:uncharacterized protein YqhQ
MEEEKAKKQTGEEAPIPAEEENQMKSVAVGRVSFKIHLTVFVVVNLVLWCLWFTIFNAIVTNETIADAILKTSVCITVVWFLIVLVHYLIVYRWNSTLVEKEVRRMKKARKKALKEIEEMKKNNLSAKKTEEKQ